MARLLPIDLVNAQFSKASFGGYKPEEVNVLVDRAAQALEEMAGENEELRAQVLRLRGELDQMRGEERLVKDAIVSAQRAAELLRADAGREADLIREEARQQARAERGQAQKEADGLRDEVERLRTMRKRFAAEQRAMLEKALRELADLESVPAAPVPAAAPVASPALAETVPFLEPRTSAPPQTYPTRLPPATRPLDPVVGEPLVIEDENGEKWVS